MVSQNESIVLGGGCFWCLEAYFNIIKGVLSVTSGYAGGITTNPSYDQVCSGSSGHAEVINIDFNPSKITLQQILEIFFTMHDPTTINRQGADEGTQYRSIILTNNQAQKQQALDVKTKMQQYWPNKIVTEIIDLDKFYPAEEYHQNYYINNPEAAYCQFVINPKINKFKQKFNNLIA